MSLWKVNFLKASCSKLLLALCKVEEVVVSAAILSVKPTLGVLPFPQRWHLAKPAWRQCQHVWCLPAQCCSQFFCQTLARLFYIRAAWQRPCHVCFSGSGCGKGMLQRCFWWWLRQRNWWQAKGRCAGKRNEETQAWASQASGMELPEVWFFDWENQNVASEEICPYSRMAPWGSQSSQHSSGETANSWSSKIKWKGSLAMSSLRIGHPCGFSCKWWPKI